MTRKEFDKWFKKQKIGDKLVRIRYKYNHEKEWTYSNELLLLGGDFEYFWADDWDEGYDRVEILGCIDIRDIPIPTFSELEEMQNNAAKELVDALGKVFFEKRKDVTDNTYKWNRR